MTEPHAPYDPSGGQTQQRPPDFISQQPTPVYQFQTPYPLPAQPPLVEETIKMYKLDDKAIRREQKRMKRAGWIAVQTQQQTPVIGIIRQALLQIIEVLLRPRPRVQITYRRQVEPPPMYPPYGPRGRQFRGYDRGQYW